jgi:erythromycin esterase
LVVGESVSDVEVKLAHPSGAPVTGTISGDAAPKSGEIVQVVSNCENMDVYLVPMGSGGAWSAHLPECIEGYWVRVGASHAVVTWTKPRGAPGASVVSLASRVSGPTRAAVEDVRDRAIRLQRSDPTGDNDDLNGVIRAVGAARVVACGEATHGTREFFQLKHRLFAALVERAQFDIFAIEASSAEAEQLNAYIQTGSGDPTSLIRGLGFWTWTTQEVLELVEWMRRWNENHDRKVRFVGVDMLLVEGSLNKLLEFMRDVGAGDLAGIAVDLEALRGRRYTGRHLADPALAKAIRARLDVLATSFSNSQKAWTKKAGAGRYSHARHSLRLLEQALDLDMAAATSMIVASSLRDKYMAENAEWALAEAGPKSRMFLWAHNGHVALGDTSFVSLGRLLRQRWGQGLLVIGFAFAEGGFQAVDAEQFAGPRGFLVPPIGNEDVTAPFVAAGLDLAFLDLRSLPPGAKQWFSSAHILREVGSVFYEGEALAWPAVITDRFDALVFVRHTTRAHYLGPQSAGPLVRKR